jgi:O-antigen/teichoic acid export membrane protein
MSRLKNFTSSVLSGYAALAANIIYTFASVPLALHYLSRPEFGLWAVVVEISGFIMLLEMGMSGSISRVLIDHKDDPAGGAYGRVVKTGALVGVVQGAIMTAIGIALAYPLGYVLDLPANLRRDWNFLIIGQSILLGITFSGRIYYQLLIAHQRYDIVNYCNGIMFIVSLFGMWAGFEAGWGIYSLLIMQAVGAVFTVVGTWLACVRLKALPPPGQGGRASWEEFKRIFAYGRDIFIYTIGIQITFASQTALVTRLMGLEAAAVWRICSRIFNLLGMIIWKMHDYAAPALAEMLVQGQKDRMQKRLRDLALLTTNLSVVGGIMMALCNTNFVHVWTRGRIEWFAGNDWLLFIWFVLVTTMRAHISLAIATKHFGRMGYLFLLEGALFIGLNVIAQKVDGISRMLIISIFCTAAITLPSMLIRTRNYFGMPWREIASWYQSTWSLTWILLVGAGLLTWATHGMDPLWKLTVNASVGGVFGLFALVRFGLGDSLRSDIAGKLPTPFRRVFLSLSGRETSAGAAI